MEGIYGGKGMRHAVVGQARVWVGKGMGGQGWARARPWVGGQGSLRSPIDVPIELDLAVDGCPLQTDQGIT